ncbi:RNA polymerase sigma-70 factor [Chitinophaga silvatica]|uniref:RNA polymerase sigma-70 factor n=1 Tax=Chitinophaga silvatica TaxID=2282649 RepID=A0A3E1YAB2_9BACT|nr:RNA polymerase sigma-70 factor [Chitinophaga silvatica]RFS22411.1 RNA polymerase sigma-70 factor [Chitinophaga silvatica]
MPVFEMPDSPVQSPFEALFTANNEKIFRFALKLTGDPLRAQEITQQCFIKLWENIHKVQEGQDIFPLLFVYVKHIVIDEARKHYREQKLLSEVAATQITEPSEETVDKYYIRKEFDLQLSKAIELLPEQRRNVYLLSRQSGLSNKQIANKLSISVSTVKNHLGSALQSIKQQMNTTFDLND